MQINLNVRLSHQKDSDYNIDIDIDPERIETNSKPRQETPKTVLGAVQRPDADRLRIIKSPRLQEEDEETAKVMDGLALE